MLRVPRFLLYWLALLAGVTGVSVEGISLLKNWKERLLDPDYSPLLSFYDYFSAEVIFLLSLMLLILVHIGHVVGGRFHISRTEKPISSAKQQVGSLLSADLVSQSQEYLGTQAQTDKATADERLAPLVKKSKNDPVA
jgi:hypothetical protein